MQIKQNKELMLTEDQVKAWPFWSYGYHGTDGIDWRQYHTAGGFESLPSYTEEAEPLSIRQAYSLGLMCSTVTTGYPDGGGVQYDVLCYDGRSIGQIAEYLMGTYSHSEGLSIRFHGSDEAYGKLEDVPAPYARLAPVSTEMILKNGTMELTFRLYKADPNA